MIGFMTLSPGQMQHLAYVRHLHQLAVDQARLPEPLCSTSVLLLHDAAESFLMLAAEHFGATDSGEFLGYWKILKPHAGGKMLPMFQGMKVLNILRKELKHRGIQPSKQSIETALENTAAFLASSAEMLFDLDFSSVSMVSLIGQDPARQFTVEAEQLVSSGDIVTAMMRLRDAFDQLFSAHRPPDGWRPRPNWWHQPSALSFGPDLDWFVRSNMSQLGLEDEFKPVKETVQALQAAARMTALSIDYADFLRFDLLTPKSRTYSLSAERFVRWSVPRGYAPDQEAFDFCLQFLVTASLRLAAAEARVADPSWLTRDHVGRLETEFLRDEPLIQDGPDFP